MVERVKFGRVFWGIGDNWDLKVLKGYMRKDFYLFVLNFIENRVNFLYFLNVYFKGVIVNFFRDQFSLNVRVESLFEQCKDNCGKNNF